MHSSDRTPHEEESSNDVPPHRFVLRALCSSLTIPLTLACTGLTIHFSNEHEMLGTAKTLLPSVVLLTIVSALILAIVQLPLARRKKTKDVGVFVLLLGIFLWIQSNLFNWYWYGIENFPDHPIGPTVLGWFELCFYGVATILALRYFSFLSKYFFSIASILILMQVLPLSIPLAKSVARVYFSKENSPLSWKDLEWTLAEFFQFSDRQNAIVIVLDSFGYKDYEALARREEEIATGFKDFTVFSNALSDSRFTHCGVPQILTGCDLNVRIDRYVLTEFLENYEEFLRESFQREQCLPEYLSRRGFQCRLCTLDASTIHVDPSLFANVRLISARKNVVVYWTEVFPVLIKFYDYAFFRACPAFFKEASNKLFQEFYRKYMSHLSTYSRLPGVGGKGESAHYLPCFTSNANDYFDIDFQSRMEEAAWSADAEKPCFRFIHLNGAHAPFNMDEHGRRMNTLNVDSMDRQCLGTLRIVLRFLAHLKKIGAYDNSTIVITGDHGSYLGSIEPFLDRSQLIRPVIMIKRPETRQAETLFDDTPVHIKDISGTVLAESGLARQEEWVSMFHIPDDLVEERKIRWSRQLDIYALPSPSDEFLPASPRESTESPESLSDRAPPRFEAVLKDHRLRVEIFGDDRDDVGRRGLPPMEIFLCKPENHSTLYRTSPKSPHLPTYTWPQDSSPQITLAVNYWGFVLEISCRNVADGTYSIGAAIPAENGRKRFFPSGKTVTVQNGRAIEVR